MKKSLLDQKNILEKNIELTKKYSNSDDLVLDVIRAGFKPVLLTHLFEDYYWEHLLF